MSRRYRVLLVGTHPVQYSSPAFRKLAQHPKLDILVAYLSLPGTQAELDPGCRDTVRRGQRLVARPGRPADSGGPRDPWETMMPALVICRDGDIRHYRADISKMRSHLGFEPRYLFPERVEDVFEGTASQSSSID